MANIQGEGDYVAGRKYQEAQHKFAKEGRVEEAGREAAGALDGSEGAELERARRTSAKGPAHEAAAKREAAHRDHKLDESLEQTYPASDPAPTSPGAD